MRILLIVFTLLCFPLGASASLITNPSFEDGLNGWTSTYPTHTYAVTSYVASNGIGGDTVTMLATEGSSFATLIAGNPINTLTSDLFTVNAGDTVTFDWFFSANDYLPYDDFASWSLDLITGTVAASNVLARIFDVGDLGLTGWNTGSFTSPVSGDVSLSFYSENIFDGLRDSVLGVDNIRVGSDPTPTSVPEPATFALMALGLLGLSLKGKRTAFNLKA